jgi:RNA polymerase sigma-70 factor (ECF subfamily)
MLGSFADAEDLVQEVLLRAWRARNRYAGQAPLSHWLMRIATNACLDELARQLRERRSLPQLDGPPTPGMGPIESNEPAAWLTPAPDDYLFQEPARALETRESVALAFLALLQRLPPRQRAALLLKDVVGWSAAEVASALELSLSSVNSALHRARQTIASLPPARSSEPTPELLQEYIRCWEAQDIDAMLSLLRQDIVFAMPPFATWFRGLSAVEGFLRSPVLSERWSPGFRTLPTRANGMPGLAFYRGTDTGYRASSLQILRFVDDRVAEVVAFIGPEYLHGFDLPAELERHGER